MQPTRVPRDPMDGTKATSIGMRGRDYMRDRGFAWRSDDRKTKKWRPQGITLLSRDSSDRAAVVSWYSSIEGDKGVRLSFVALEGDARYKYRHVLLVRPSNDGKLFEPGGACCG